MGISTLIYAGGLEADRQTAIQNEIERLVPGVAWKEIGTHVRHDPVFVPSRPLTDSERRRLQEAGFEFAKWKNRESFGPSLRGWA